MQALTAPVPTAQSSVNSMMRSLNQNASSVSLTICLQECLSVAADLLKAVDDLQSKCSGPVPPRPMETDPVGLHGAAHMLRSRLMEVRGQLEPLAAAL